MKINLHIERLVLDGLPLSSVEGPQLRRAVQAELSRLLTSGGLSQELRSGGAVPHISAGVVHVARNNSPGKLGTQIARALHQGIGTPK